jgi:hypothetical protein
MATPHSSVCRKHILLLLCARIGFNPPPRR